MLATTETLGGRAGLKKNDDFKNLVDLLAVFSEAENRLDQLQAEVNEATLEVVDEHKDEFAELQEKLVEAEGALELIARRHPDWFTTKATLKTPYGSVAVKNNPPKLVAANEEVSIVLIEAEIEKHQDVAEHGARNLLRKKTELNLEALASLGDVELAKYRIKRVQGDTFSVKAAKLDLGRAVKEASAKKN